MNLLDKILELEANSVTSEDFLKTWGFAQKDFLDSMMAFIREQKTTAEAGE